MNASETALPNSTTEAQERVSASEITWAGPRIALVARSVLVAICLAQFGVHWMGHSQSRRTMDTLKRYEIRIAGHLTKGWTARFEGLSLRHEPAGETVLSGRLDQAVLHGVLVRIRDLGLKLIPANRTGVTGASWMD